MLPTLSPKASIPVGQSPPPWQQPIGPGTSNGLCPPGADQQVGALSITERKGESVPQPTILLLGTLMALLDELGVFKRTLNTLFAAPQVTLTPSRKRPHPQIALGSSQAHKLVKTLQEQVQTMEQYETWLRVDTSQPPPPLKRTSTEFAPCDRIVNQLMESCQSLTSQIQGLFLLTELQQQGKIGDQGDSHISLCLWQDICQQRKQLKKLLDSLSVHSMPGLYSVEPPPPISPSSVPQGSQALSARKLTPVQKQAVKERVIGRLKQEFGQSRQPVLITTLQGRMYELLVIYSLQTLSGEHSVCDTNVVAKNFPLFDAIWKSPVGSPRLLSMKCHLNQHTPRRASQYIADLTAHINKLEQHEPLLERRFSQHQQRLGRVLDSPMRALISSSADQLGESGLGHFLENYSRLPVTRSTKKAIVALRPDLNRFLIDIDFSTEEQTVFLEQLKGVILTKTPAGRRSVDERDQLYRPDVTAASLAARKKALASVRRKIKF